MVLPAVRSESRDSFGLSISALALSDEAAKEGNVGPSKMTADQDETCSAASEQNGDADHPNEVQRRRSSSAEEEGGCFDLSSWPSIQVIPLQRSVKLVSRPQQFRLANPNLPVSPRDHPGRSSTPPALLLRERMSAHFTETKAGQNGSLTEQ